MAPKVDLDSAFVSWCREGTSDKVWGSIKLRNGTNFWEDNSYVTFWGRRGAKLQTKIVKCDTWTMAQMINKKEAKGYLAVATEDLKSVYPEFEDDLKKTAFWNMLKV